MTTPAPIPFRLVGAAMLMACVVFAAVAAWLLSTTEGPGLLGEPVPMLEWIGVAFAAVAAATAFALQRVNPLVPIALCEGAILFNLVAWLLNGTTAPSLITAGVLFVAGLWLLVREPPGPEA